MPELNAISPHELYSWQKLLIESMVHDESKPLNRICLGVDRALGRAEGQSLSLFYFMAAYKNFDVFLDSGVIATDPIAKLADTRGLTSLVEEFSKKDESHEHFA